MRTSVFFGLLTLALPLTTAAQEHGIELRLHLTKGDTHQMNVTLDQTIGQTVEGKHQETRQIIGYVCTFAVDDVDDRGVATLSVHYDSVSFHAKTPAGTVDYDSSQPPGMVPPMVSGYAAIVGQGYSMKVSPDGKVIQVSGLDNLLKTLLGKLNVPEGPARAAAEKALRQQINEQTMRENLQHLFAPLPNGPVVVGQSWSRKGELSLSLGFPLAIETRFALRSEQNGIAVVDLTGSSSTAPSATVDLGQMKMSYDLHGPVKGTFQIAESNGWIQESQTEQTLSGSATVRVPNAATQVVPLTIHATMTTRQQ